MATSTYTVQLHARAEPEEARKIEQNAEKLGMSKSRLLVESALAYDGTEIMLRKHLRLKDEMVLQDTRDAVLELARQIQKLGVNLNQIATAANRARRVDDPVQLTPLAEMQDEHQAAVDAIQAALVTLSEIEQ